MDNIENDPLLLKLKREKFRVEIKRQQTEKLFKYRRIISLQDKLDMKEKVQSFFDYLQSNKTLLMDQTKIDLLCSMGNNLKPQSEEECLQLINSQFKMSSLDIIQDRIQDKKLKNIIIECLVDITYYEMESIDGYIVQVGLINYVNNYINEILDKKVLIEDDLQSQNMLQSALFLLFNIVLHLKTMKQLAEIKKLQTLLETLILQSYVQMIEITLKILLLIIEDLDEPSFIIEKTIEAVMAIQVVEVPAMKVVNKFLEHNQEKCSQVIKFYDRFQNKFIFTNNIELQMQIIIFFQYFSLSDIQADVQINESLYSRLSELFIHSNEIKLLADIMVLFGNLFVQNNTNANFIKLFCQSSYFLQKMKQLYNDQFKNIFFELWNLSNILIWILGDAIFSEYDKNQILYLMIEKFVEMPQSNQVNQFLEALLNVEEKSILKKYPNFTSKIEQLAKNGQGDTTTMAIEILDQLKMCL